MDLAIRQVDKDSRKVTLSFSSEQAVSRWYGQEILAHDADCVNLARMNEIGVILFNHNRDKVLGRIERAWLGDDHRCYADVIFDDDEDAEKIFRKVESGTLKGVSVGYAVDVWEEVAAGKQSSNGRFTGPAYIAVRWSPLEVSIVSVPADDSVGVGRELENPEAVPAESRTDNQTGKEEMRTMGDELNNKAPEASGSPNENALRQEAIQAERQRVSDITTLCRDFGIDPKTHIDSGASIEAVRQSVLEEMKRKWTPSSAGGDIRVDQDEADKFREAASDSILLRGGKTIAKPADGARDLRGMKLRDFAIECLVRAGIARAHRMDSDELFRAAISPDSQFAGILSNAVNKSMSSAYKAAEPTYKQWTGIGSNPDFKTATHYQISEAGDLLPMTQVGEFKFDELSDKGVSKAVATFGRSWGLSRQALINDDIAMLTRVPDAYVRAAIRGINKLVYKMLGSNPTIYDGQLLFHSAHRNIASSGGAISTETLGAGRKAMRTQKNLRGKETLNIAPAFLIVPAALETGAQQFLVSLADPEGKHSGVTNVFRNSLDLVVDAELDSYDDAEWYLAASPADIDTIEVTYLNGDEMPKLESQVGFDFLGIKWRIYIDYGVNVLDFRGLYKNEGE